MERILLLLGPLEPNVLSFKNMQWSCDVHEARNKPSIVRAEAEKKPQLRQSLRRWPDAHGLHFLGLHLYPIFRQHVAQELYTSLKEDTFLQIQLQGYQYYVRSPRTGRWFDEIIPQQVIQLLIDSIQMSNRMTPKPCLIGR